ncbi:SGNH/GDSL hydrolase family protein [Polymorphobacter fuscus]|uniref:SGNH/GDSL hydrolase family protein n=2 Tax=Sandarakinorhabdus fusca TaxID=1439888 RepID=A0A7C9KXH4_9SPHN|nr:SGNH/GDSL hydrolase family protein [Polymorphobacter fuscus]KAB7646593.1 SGNH/GDSL hydrolase family protein [Polymorphobacter fuscus]MQT17502.1 SGNH/GDSL hydrolase family protein [Polymorphobacter fuscus]
MSGSAQATAAERWIPAWTGPPIGYEPGIRDGLGRAFKDETVRQDLRVAVTGKRLRVRFTNELADTPLRIGAASILRLDADGGPVPDSLRPLTFAGDTAARIPAHAPMLSDPFDYPVSAGERLAISVWFPDDVAPPAHAQMVDIAAGNATAARELPTPRRARASGLASALEVTGASATRVLVTFGDSITEGAGATPGKAMSWPDQLGRRLAAAPGGRCWAVANQGISGNRLLDSGRGPSALARFDRDVLAVPGATHVVILEGINDIGKVRDAADWQPLADALIAAYEQLLARARAGGLRVIFGTLLPYQGAAYADAAGEQRRQAVNAWIRANRKRFDGVIDFDTAMGEPGQPGVMRLSGQIGDHLHPNDAGYTAMAEAALPVILAQGCR